MSSIEFFAAIAAVIIAAIAPTITLGVYLSSRIDRLSDQLGGLGGRVSGLEVTVTAGFARVDERLDRLEKALADHIETHVRLAHPR